MRELKWKGNGKEILATNEQEFSQMEKEEAINILEDKLDEYRKLGYSKLVGKIGEVETFEGKNLEGDQYQIEVEFFYDGFEETDLRVAGMISYNFWTDFSPVCGDFIIAPNGKFIGE
ncbi:MAG TPA: hypothetical protein VK892_10260 [Pyrinomonadaceae bacterium]|nr:hypothetical protein [Pyrinomonadaceae bacterium]